MTTDQREKEFNEWYNSKAWVQYPGQTEPRPFAVWRAALASMSQSVPGEFPEAEAIQEALACAMEFPKQDPRMICFGFEEGARWAWSRAVTEREQSADSAAKNSESSRTGSRAKEQK